MKQADSILVRHAAAAAAAGTFGRSCLGMNGKSALFWHVSHKKWLRQHLCSE